MRGLLGALAIIGSFASSASAEPVSLDEASLNDVVAGLPVPALGNIDIDVATIISTPVVVSNDIDTNVGAALAANITAVAAVLSSGVSGSGNAAAGLNTGAGVPSSAGF